MAGFEDKLTALEQVVERLERGDLSLDESVKLFEEGVKLSDDCKKELEAAEGKIQILINRGNGAVKTADFDIDESNETAEDED
ncbi:exodeoxyribonuclease 7 small subunit [Edaphobacter acidisoli]|uniref:Exodeoxyribonuclease 7 small subunit n=1 Tax=Edaphobacter acidisoli TaxID=2040573 RepID=A0A916RIY7_9BACT|nr:exodeoxyribonuclease VII small subunit [Edaphobacter acidisoli]GGA59065.1 exodeoxyribonuclease 7 small subunit [Edaphobacter acidisoli]